MTEVATRDQRASAWEAPPGWVGAVIGAVVVLAFTVVHVAFITDIWFNFGPMLFAGAMVGAAVVWSYRSGVADHSSVAWFRLLGVYALELIALGGVSLLVLRPRFTMAALMVADDSFEQLLGPSMPLMIGAMAVGTVAVWLYSGRRRKALGPIMVTQILLVFLLGHQFAFLGLVESSSTLFRLFGEFALITVGLAATFGLGVMWSTKMVRRRAQVA